MPGRLQQTIAEYPTFTDEKLEEYLGIWTRLIEQGDRQILDITLSMHYQFDLPLAWKYELTFGEEIRDLTRDQAFHVKTWLDSLPRN